MAPDLENLLTQIMSVKMDAESLVHTLDAETFNRRPADGGWSIAENISHLNVSLDQYLPVVNAAVQQGRAQGPRSSGPFQYSTISGIFVRTIEPPVKFRVKAPKQFLPSSNVERQAELDRFIAMRDRLAALVRESDGLDLAQIRLVSPASKLLKLPLGQAFQAMTAHDRRHLWQARRVAISFASSTQTASAS